jgi:uncharacterized protein YbjT (DUF2867 family)
MGHLTTLAQEAAVAGVARFVRVSGIGADPESRSPYIRARGRGELVVQQVFPAVSIVRPGVMFGPDDAARRKARRPDKAVQDLPLPRPSPTRGTAQHSLRFLQKLPLQQIADMSKRAQCRPQDSLSPCTRRL